MTSESAAGPGGAILQARGLQKSYRRPAEEVKVLRGVDLDVAPGDFVAVTGPSGSGKSTLLHVLGLMDEPTAGEVRLFGAAASSLDEVERARLRNSRLGFVFQFDSLLPDFTIAENVVLPARIAAGQGTRPAGGSWAAMEERARKLLAHFGIGALGGRFPMELSGGERQRAALARALLTRPAILLADEPTGNLDKESGELVFSSLKAAAEDLKTAVVLVTHHDYAARFASRVLRLCSGVLEAAGPAGGAQAR